MNTVNKKYMGGGDNLYYHTLNISPHFVLTTKNFPQDVAL